MDIKQNYIEKGQGEPLIMLHGNGEDCTYFKRQMDDFSKHFRTISLESRGHGDTAYGEKPFSLFQFADDRKDFMNENDIPKAHILGFSDGGNVAIIFAMRYPEMVDKLIIDGANLNLDGLKKYFVLSVKLRYRFSKNDKVLKLLDLMLKEPDLSFEDIKCITAKTLVMAGTNDLIKLSHTKKIAQAIPDSRLCILKGPHSLAAVKPREFNKAVLDYLL